MRTKSCVPWDRGATVALLIVLAIALGSLIWFVFPYCDARVDSAVYILTSESIRNGEGYSYLGGSFTLRPPGFSILLLPIQFLFGRDFAALNAYTSLFGVACVVLLFLYVRPFLGSLISACYVVCIWFNPFFQRLCNQTMSDIPAVAAVLACLLLERRQSKAYSTRTDFLLGFLIAATCYVRTIGFLLIPAILLARILRHRRPRSSMIMAVLKRSALVFFIPLLTWTPWVLRDVHCDQRPPEDQLRDYSHSAAMWRADPQDPRSPYLSIAALLGRVPRQLQQVLPFIGSRMQSSTPTPVNITIGIVSVLCFLIFALWQRDAGSIWACLVLALMSIMFAYAGRLVLPAYLLIFPGLLVVLDRLLKRLLPTLHRPVIAVVLVTVALTDADPRAYWPEAIRAHRTRSRIASFLENRFEPDDRIAAKGGMRLAMYLSWPVYSLGAALDRGGLGGAVGTIIKHRIQAVVLNRKLARTKRLHECLVQSFSVERQIGPYSIFLIDDLARLSNRALGG